MPLTVPSDIPLSDLPDEMVKDIFVDVLLSTALPQGVVRPYHLDAEAYAEGLFKVLGKLSFNRRYRNFAIGEYCSTFFLVASFREDMVSLTYDMLLKIDSPLDTIGTDLMHMARVPVFQWAFT